MTSSRLPALLAVFLLAAPLALAQPSNSAIRSSFPVVATTTTYTGTNVGISATTTESPTASCQSNDGGNAVWWYFRATSTGPVTIDLTGSNFDTVLTVLDPALNEIACDDDGGTGTQSRLTTSVTGGTYYHVRVSGFNGQSGSIAMAIGGSPIAGPAGDRIFGTVVLTLPFNRTIQESSVGAGGEAGEPAGSCGGGGAMTSIWRAFTATTTGPLVVRTSGSNFDTVVDVFTFQPSGLVESGCNDDSGDTPADRSSRTQWDAVTGQTYFVRIRGFNGATGSVQLLLFTPRPTAADEAPEAAFTFAAPSPNPAVGAVRLGATLATPGVTRVEVFDALGRSVAVVADGDLPAGDASWTWDATGQPAGVYIVQLTTEAGTATRRVSIVR